MQKIENWNEIEAKGISDFISLLAGAYKCIIKKAEDYKNTENGKESLRLELDIDEGEFKDYFKKRYENNQNADAKWDSNAVKYLGLGENALPFFKGAITAVENSNNGYQWNWDEKTLEGKKVGALFLPEEYTKQDGTIGVRIKVSQFRSIDKIDSYNNNFIRIKKLDGSTMNYEEYKANIINKEVAQFNSDVNLSDDDLPF